MYSILNHLQGEIGAFHAEQSVANSRSEYHSAIRRNITFALAKISHGKAVYHCARRYRPRFAPRFPLFRRERTKDGWRIWYNGSMSQSKTGKLLSLILAHPDCTKLYLKQASGYSMTTTLKGVDFWQKRGWIEVDEVPQATGRAHAKIRASTRPILGVAQTDGGWEVCAVSLCALKRFKIERYEVKPVLPAPCPTYDGNPLSWAYLAAIWLKLDDFALVLTPAEVLLLPEDKIVDASGSLSSYFLDRRLTWGEAWAYPSLREEIIAEIREAVAVWTNKKVVLTKDDLPQVPAAALAAYGEIYKMLTHEMR